MASTFTGLNISSAGLYSSQSAMYTTNSNISNASTDGYSLQNISTSAGQSTLIYGNMSTSSGAQITDITRERNVYYDMTFRDQTSVYQHWYSNSKTLTEIEGIFNEPSDEGLSALTSDFNNALEDLTISPDNSAARASLLEAGNALCDTLNTTAEKLYTLQSDLNSEIPMHVDHINSLAEQIAYLNAEIDSVEQLGGNPNTLYDARDLLIDDLSELTEVNVIDGDTGSQCRVLIDGYPVVSGSKVYAMEVYTDETLSDGSPQWDIRWEGNQNPVKFNEGTIKSTLDLRDGTGTNNTYNGIPHFLNELDTFAQDLARSFNEGMDSEGNSLENGHRSGYTENGDTDICFFTINNMNSTDFIASASTLTETYDTVSALNISLSFDVEDTPEAIAVSSNPNEETNSETIESIIDVLSQSQLTQNGTLNDSLIMIQTTLGIDASYAIRMESSELSLLEQAENNRLSVSSVSLDEEMTQLTQQEQLYTAAAQMIQVWQDIFDTTIRLIGG